ncbi:hypothetical protein Tco_0465216 [Tanacetum coccineum]
MRLNEIHKFSDGTLTRVMEKLDHMVKDFHLFEYNKGMETRKWSEDDKRRSKDFITAIEKRLQIRRIFRSLESFDTYPILLSFTHYGNKSILRVLRIILVILPEHPSETKVLHNEDGNPARANIKQALGSYERPHKGVKASANSDIVYFFTSAQDGDPLQDDPLISRLHPFDEWESLGLPRWIFGIGEVGLRESDIFVLGSRVAGVKVCGFGKIGPSSCVVVLHGSSFVVYMFVDLTTSVPEVVFLYYNHSP